MPVFNKMSVRGKLVAAFFSIIILTIFIGSSENLWNALI